MTQPRQLQELALGVAHNTMKLLCGSSFRAQAVLLRGISPLPITRYRRYFNAGILKGQDCNALVFHRSQLEQAIELRDPLLYRTLVQYLSAYAARPKDLRSQVEFLILRMLPTQRCRLPLVAEQLGLHERVLQRRLAEQGCGFDDLLEGLRKERADCYLAERDMSMSQVAGLLGYSEQSVFNRACRRWSAWHHGRGAASCWKENSSNCYWLDCAETLGTAGDSSGRQSVRSEGQKVLIDTEFHKSARQASSNKLISVSYIKARFNTGQPLFCYAVHSNSYSGPVNLLPPYTGSVWQD